MSLICGRHGGWTLIFAMIMCFWRYAHGDKFKYLGLYPLSSTTQGLMVSVTISTCRSSKMCFIIPLRKPNLFVNLLGQQGASITVYCVSSPEDGLYQLAISQAWKLPCRFFPAWISSYIGRPSGLSWQFPRILVQVLQVGARFIAGQRYFHLTAVPSQVVVTMQCQ